MKCESEEDQYKPCVWGGVCRKGNAPDVICARLEKASEGGDIALIDALKIVQEGYGVPNPDALRSATDETLRQYPDLDEATSEKTWAIIKSYLYASGV